MPYAHHGDVEIYYETFGDRADPALLMINGLGSQCINYRSEWCEKFAAEGFYTIRFDNRDVGLSTKLDDATGSPAYTLADMAGDTLAVLDAEGVTHAHVMGLSMGGMIVQRLAIDHPDRLLSITSVMSTTGDLSVGQGAPDAVKLLTTPGPTDRDGVVQRYLLGIRTYGSPAYYDETRLVPLAQEAFDRCFHPAGTLRQMMAVMADGDRTEALSSVAVPALVMHGDQDRLIDVGGGRATADAIPGAKFVVFEGMGHDYPPQYWDDWVGHVAAHARAATAQESQP